MGNLMNSPGRSLRQAQGTGTSVAERVAVAELVAVAERVEASGK